MNAIYVLDASALVAFLLKETGGEKVLDVYKNAVTGTIRLLINKINLLEVYYGFYRVHGKAMADKMTAAVKASPIEIVSDIDDALYMEAGRLKASYKISLADSFALAQAKVTNGILLTSDHHELDAVDANEPIQFLWIR